MFWGKQEGDVIGVLSNTYYFWLCELVHMYSRNNYNLLIRELHKKKFRWFVPNDDNRAFEGKNLRERFCDEEGIDYEYCSLDFEEDTSMLELLIGLAFRCDSIMADTADNVSINEWFFRLLTNVGLDKFTDDDYYYHGGSIEVNKILDKIIDRKYHRSGKGGLFPLKRAKKDQRKVEIWYQMCQYLVENYYNAEIFV